MTVDRHRPGADPVRQLGDPPERRRGRPTTVRLRLHLDGRTAAGIGHRGRRGRAARPGRAHARRGAALPARPGLAGADPADARAGRRPAVDEATAHAAPAERADRVARLRRRRRRAGDGRLLPHRRTGRRRSPTRPARPSPARPPRRRWTASPAATARTGWPGSPPAGWPTSTARALGARAAAKARAAADPVELPPGRYEVVLEPTAVADILQNLAWYGFNGKAVRRAAVVRRARRGPVRPGGDARRRPAGGGSACRSTGGHAATAR